MVQDTIQIEERARMKKRGKQTLRTTTVCWLRAEEPPFDPNCQGFCGNACVSVHLSPVSTPSLRSVGHSPKVHGTPAQYKLATSTYLYVGCNVAARQEPRAKPRNHVERVFFRKMLFIANVCKYFYIE
jgi:hypothetical protein